VHGVCPCVTELSGYQFTAVNSPFTAVMLGGQGGAADAPLPDHGFSDSGGRNVRRRADRLLELPGRDGSEATASGQFARQPRCLVAQ